MCQGGDVLAVHSWYSGLSYHIAHIVGCLTYLPLNIPTYIILKKKRHSSQKKAPHETDFEQNSEAA